MRVLSCTRINSRAVPSNVAFEMFESVHSIRTPSRWIGPGVTIGAVAVYPATLKPAKVGVVRQVRAGNRGIFDMDGIEVAVLPIVGIELKTDEAVGVANFKRELVEQPGRACRGR